ncbi:unnamed protein product [Allacma fusca]|uniref:Uncharacterized protein n=1 Tax=Allacma fusca TaxID=39272 RepID=A0A8J2LNN4_9HEXA|nr:unnamed protein product [Allacma fusca]
MSTVETVRMGLVHFKNRLFHKFKDLNDTSNEDDVVDKVVVITGSNSGIGKVLALHMAKRGAVVVMVCRNVSKAEASMEEIKKQVPEAKLNFVRIDLSDMESVTAGAKEIKEKFDTINILVNNAGYMSDSPQTERTKAGLEKHLATNYLGHYLLTLHLLENLKKGAPSRIVSVASTFHETAKLRSGDLNMEKKVYKGPLNLFGAYMNSKRCVMLFSKELGKRLEGTQVRTYSLCPGLVDTGLFNDFSLSAKAVTKFMHVFAGCNPEQGTETLMYCSTSQECAQDSGKAYRFSKIWSRADELVTDDDATKLWNETEALLGIQFREFGIMNL